MMERKNAANLFLLGITAVALYLCYRLFRPYATPILFSSVIAIVFYPLHRYMRRFFRSPSLSAFISTLVTLLLSVVPLTFLLLALSHELTTLYQNLTARSAESGGAIAYLLRSFERLTSWATSRLSIPGIDLHGIVLSRLENISSSLLHFGASLVSNALSLVVNAVFALIVLFFLFRDAESALSKVMAALPLDEKRANELRSRIQATVVTNFYGSFVIGALQGTLTGLTFWTLGIDSPVLWGVATAVCSLIPFFGSATIWLPASIALLLTGHPVKGIILVGMGTVVIGTVDNIVRPLIIQRSVRLHPLLVLFSILGGLQLFGIPGLFVGPVILSVTAALVPMLQKDIVGTPEEISSDVHATTAPDK
jgi:predicted PurR-regulated permease PerM